MFEEEKLKMLQLISINAWTWPWDTFLSESVTLITENQKEDRKDQNIYPK